MRTVIAAVVAEMSANARDHVRTITIALVIDVMKEETVLVLASVLIIIVRMRDVSARTVIVMKDITEAERVR